MKKCKRKNLKKDLLTFLDEIQDQSHQAARKKFLINELKNLSLRDKEKMAIVRIKEFLSECDKNNMAPVISFSGGKDSCVLRHLVNRVRKSIKLETAAEIFNPEIALFLQSIPKSEITFFSTLMSFKDVIKHYGFPIISKEMSQKINNVRNSKTLGKWTRACFGLRSSRKISKKYLHFLDKDLVKYEISNICCSLIKGRVKYSKTPKFVGTTIQESQLRRTSWLKNGCNFYGKDTWCCRPISLFTEEDIWAYIKKYNVPYSKAYGNYGDKWSRTGCICCGFGLSFEQKLSDMGIKRSRFELLFDYYPNAYKKYMYEYGMYKPLCDYGIRLNIDDKKYQKYFKERNKLISKWYSKENFRNNLLRIIRMIEKQTKSKFKDTEIEQIFINYGEKYV